MAKRIIQTDLAGEDIVIEKGLRPESLDQYVGQSKAKNNLIPPLLIISKFAIQYI